jgi:uncharacterized protein YegP (UPF0339 family)
VTPSGAPDDPRVEAAARAVSELYEHAAYYEMASADEMARAVLAAADAAVPDPHGAFEVYRDHRGEFRWRLVSDGHVLANSADGYLSEGAARMATRYAGRVMAAVPDPREENARLREAHDKMLGALKLIDVRLTTAEGDGIPRGMAAPMGVRLLARQVIEDVTGRPWPAALAPFTGAEDGADA